MSHPILYSLRNCPYAIRARLVILLAKQTVILRAIVLKNKPVELLAASSKGEVPVLVLPDSTVIDESIDIMLWALHEHDPENLLYRHSPDIASSMTSLIKYSDNEFKANLDKYKSAKRYHDNFESQYRQQCEVFILELEQRLNLHRFFMGDTPSLADYAILPFIRQFARVNRKAFLQAPYPNLRHWLDTHLQSRSFAKAMTLTPLWLENREVILFGDDG